MAMIKCAECGKEFSDRANACPNCGCPIEYQAEKSIGGEYHAADKLAPSVIVEHLTIAKELESERYTLQLAIAKIQSKINTLGYYNQFTPPKSVSVKKIFYNSTDYTCNINSDLFSYRFSYICILFIQSDQQLL